MNADNQALNIPEDADASLEAGGSPAPEIQLSDEELVSTLDPPDFAGTDPEGANNTGEPADDDDDDKDGKGEKDELTPDGDDDKGKPDGDDTRYDKDPRWIKNREDTAAATERAIKAEARAEALEELRREAPAKDGADGQDYTDISTLSPDQVREMVDEDPTGFFSNLTRQIKAEVTNAVNQTTNARTQEEKVMGTLDDYASKHADFDPMWNSGELKRFIASNPGHNAISAHQTLISANTAKSAQDTIDEAVAKAVKETEEKVIKNFKAKGNSRVMGGSPGGRGVVSRDDEVTAILKDTKKAGGDVAAGVKALQIRRAQAEGR